MIEQYILEKILDACLNAAKQVLKEPESKLLTTKEDIEGPLSHHLQFVKNWAGEVSFADLKKPKRTTDIFIHLDLFLSPRRLRMNVIEPIDNIPLKDIFEISRNHIVILGQPGAGKTTSMKYLCQALFYDESFYSDRFTFPILIRFRDLNNIKFSAEASPIIDQLYNILGLKLDWAEELQKPSYTNERKYIKERLVIDILRQLNVLLILDGFDELNASYIRDQAIQDIRTLSTHLDHSTLITTSRTGDFIYSINNTVQYEICPLSKEQILIFAIKWLADREKANDFLAKIYGSPFADTAIRPLTLAHLCAIYEREGDIPDKPKSAYRKIVNLLLEEWDQQRSVKRYSKYAQFEVDRKFEFLCQLAYELTTWLKKTVFSKADLTRVYKRIHYNYGLLHDEAKQVVAELETHTGLLLQTGYEVFEFAHKSLQEYLTAEYLVRLPSIPSDVKGLATLPNELAIAISISSNPSSYFSELISKMFTKQKLSEVFLKAFLNRLLLEKPDFNSHPPFSLSFITMYSLYVEYYLKGGKQLKSLQNDRLIREFENLMKSTVNKNSIKLIQKRYSTDSVYDMENGDNIHRLVKREDLTDSLSPQLPNTIYLRNYLLERAN